MWYFKRKLGQGKEVKHVIHNECYQKLPDNLKSRFYPAPSDSEPTHTVYGPGKLDEFGLLAVEVAGIDVYLGSEGAPTENYCIERATEATDAGGTVDFGGFGGGDAGGSGAGDSF
jgi:hypothetical protein